MIQIASGRVNRLLCRAIVKIIADIAAWLRLLTHVGLVRQKVLILSEVSLYVERSKNLEKNMLSPCKKIHLPEGV